MNSHLKNAIDTAYTLCDALEKTDVWDSSNNYSAREIFRGELFHFLLNLSFSDAKLTQAESKFIKDYLGYDYSTKEMREYAVANNNKVLRFTTNIPYCFKAFVKADNLIDQVNETSKLILNLYKELGNEFINCDSHADFNEQYTLKSFCDKLQTYIDETFIKSVNMTLGNLNDQTKKVNLPKESYQLEVENNNVQNEIKNQEKTELKKQEKTLNELLDELNTLIGLEKVKADVNSLINLVKIRTIRKERGLESPAMSLHMVFSGNPGTGKTTIARLLSQIYKAMGLLSKGHLTEVDRSSLVGGYVGQTAIKVQSVIEKSKGGVLFIDEAYSLTVNRSATDYGFEAVDTLLKSMEDNRDDLIVIVAGYTEPMEEFLDSNPGLKSRFNKFINFDDYSPEELIGILKLKAKKSSLTLSEAAEKYSFDFFTKRCENKPENYANARDVRNYFEKSLVNQADRLAKLDNITNEQLSTIELEDVNTIIL